MEKEIIGAIKIKEGLFIEDEFAARFFIRGKMIIKF